MSEPNNELLESQISFTRDAFARLSEETALLAAKAGRSPNAVKILPVSKGQSLEKIEAVLRALPNFPRVLCENYAEELLEKKVALSHLGPIEWHYIGRAQSRQLKSLLPEIQCVQGIFRNKELDLLQKCPRPFFIQVNVSNEDQKGGLSPDNLGDFIESITEKELSTFLRGFMALAAPLHEVGESVVRAQFSLLRELRDKYCKNGMLSMGMSEDYKLAISEGADFLRLGSALFGAR